MHIVDKCNSLYTCRSTLKVIVSPFSLYINVAGLTRRLRVVCATHTGYFPYSKEPQSLSVVTR